MKYRLRYGRHVYELSEGEFLIGRSEECHLTLDDALVSRRHARLRVGEDGVVVEDLGSRNGVVVDGQKIAEPQRLRDGAVLQIGGQEMILKSVRRAEASTLAGAPPPTLKADAFGLLGGLADKALAMGRGDEASRILAGHLKGVLEDVKSGRRLGPETAARAGLYAARLAGATGRGEWVNYVFELFSMLRLPCPIEIIDQLYAVARKVPDVSLPVLRAYIETLRAEAKSPSERFILSRVEGLERLVAAR